MWTAQGTLSIIADWLVNVDCLVVATWLSLYQIKAES
jgi:hypothetical protein